MHAHDAVVTVENHMADATIEQPRRPLAQEYAVGYRRTMCASKDQQPPMIILSTAVAD